MTQAQVDQEWLRHWNEARRHRPAEPGTVGRIGAEGEPGSPLVIRGQVVAPDGVTPASGILVFAYQTDRDGLYVKPGPPSRTWRLHGWARTDAAGRFEFRTIRPGPYPGRRVPAHVHLTVDTRRYGRQWTPQMHFADDPLVTDEEREASRRGGPFGAVRPVQVVDGVQHIDVAIRLKGHADF